MKESDDAFVRIAEAFDSINDQHLTSDPRLLAAMSPEKSSTGFRHSYQLKDSTSEPHLSTDLRSSGDSDKKETQIPADLITSCVASLLMIQVSLNILLNFSDTWIVMKSRWPDFGHSIWQVIPLHLISDVA